MHSQHIEFCSVEQLLNTTRDPHSIVAFDNEHQINWQSFLNDVNHYQSLLSIHSAKRVALCFANSYLFSVGLFAAIHADKALVLPGNYQPEAVKELTPHFDILLHDENIEIAEGVESLSIKSRSLEQYIQPQVKNLNADEVELTLFTSGSSGQAKAIQKSLTQLDSEIAILESLWGEQLCGSRIESTVSHQHIYGLLFRVLWPLCASRPFAIHNLEYPEQLVHHADNDTVLISSPALLKRLTQEHQSTPLRGLFSSGGPLPNSAAVHSQELFDHLPIEVFGSTETGGIAFRQQLTPATTWRLFPGVQAELNQENCLRLLAPHINGREWYQTADECHFHDTVSFELKGRTDRIVKIEEKRISLVEVEKRLDQLEWIEESAVIPLVDDQRLSLSAVIVLSPLGLTELERIGKGKFWIALRKRLRDWLEPIAIPRKYRLLEEIPLNSQGKRQVAEIEKLFQ